MVSITESQLLKDTLGDIYSDYRHLTRVDASNPPKTRLASNKVERVVFHCTDAPHWSPERLSEFFVSERKFPICGYHYYVMADHVYQMVGENIITFHAAPFNTKSVAFSIDFFPTQYEPNNIKVNPDVFSNAHLIAAVLCLKYQITPDKNGLVGHRELPGTGWFKDAQDMVHLRKECPGLSINLDQFRFDVGRLMQTTMNKYLQPNDQLVADGIYGPKSIATLNTFNVSS